MYLIQTTFKLVLVKDKIYVKIFRNLRTEICKILIKWLSVDKYFHGYKREDITLTIYQRNF